jgi:hypothetical protein
LAGKDQQMPTFSEETKTSWRDFYDFVLSQTSSTSDRWIYRGQTKRKWSLETTIERALNDWELYLKDATLVEFQTIREFRRRLRDRQYDRVHSDKLFCLALMQHYGAPTRLLDCSYSPFVAAAFAMEKGWKGTPVVWCFKGSWLDEQARENTPHKKMFDRRNQDHERTDATFVKLFQLMGEEPDAKPEPRVQFVKVENPLHLNERLTVQQGLFLCPADLGASFVDNLTAMRGWRENVVKLYLDLNNQSAVEFARNLKNMNLGFAALFPDLQGFARSIGQQMLHYRHLDRAGLPPISEA